MLALLPLLFPVLAFGLSSDHSANWNLVNEVEFAGRIPISKFRSNRTGLTVMLAQHDYPVTQVEISVATEAFDDDGIPHVLEHLIFQGRWVEQNVERRVSA